MGNCDKCWDNPCLCGEGYKHLTPKQIAELIEVLKPMAVEKPAESTELTSSQASEEEQDARWREIEAIVADAVIAAGMRNYLMEAAFLKEDERGLLDESKLYKTAIQGPGIIIMLKDTVYGGQKSKPYAQVVKNPTWLELCVYFNKMVLTTGDKHHYFFEGIRLIEKEDARAYREIAIKRFQPMPLHMYDYPIYTFIRGS